MKKYQRLIKSIIEIGQLNAALKTIQLITEPDEFGFYTVSLLYYNGTVVNILQNHEIEVVEISGRKTDDWLNVKLRLIPIAEEAENVSPIYPTDQRVSERAIEAMKECDWSPKEPEKLFVYGAIWMRKMLIGK